MGASRESFRISDRIRYHKTWVTKIAAIYFLLESVIIDKWSRQMFMKDNYIQPFNKIIGCKLFGHKFYHTSTNGEWCCSKCWKYISEQQYESIERRKKLLRIKKRI
jgi:hypothetical protein